MPFFRNFISGTPTLVAGLSAGTATVDFGAFPGKSDASVVVTGQTGILATSRVTACIVATATDDHSADEHWVESIQVTPGSIVPGEGFTIYARNTSEISEPGPFRMDQYSQVAAAGKGGSGVTSFRPTHEPKGTRLYGKFTVHWQWV
jgi:hypothetical protein